MVEVIYKKYRERGVKFFYVYTREPHPGMYEHQQTHSMEERKKYAEEVKKELCFDLPFLFDDMEGAIQKAYGNRPNPAYIISKEGTILLKQAWADPQALEQKLEELVGKPEAEEEATQEEQ